MTEDEIVGELRNTLDMRETADMMTDRADTREAALDIVITERGYNAEALMQRAYFKSRKR